MDDTCVSGFLMFSVVIVFLVWRDKRRVVDRPATTKTVLVIAVLTFSIVLLIGGIVWISSMH